MGTTTKTSTISNFKDLRADPQVVDFFSQSGMDRSSFGTALQRQMLAALKGMGSGGYSGGGGGGGGGGYSGGGGGGDWGHERTYGYDWDLDRLNFSDPDIQMGLSANLRGSREGEADTLRQLTDAAGRSGVSGPRALAAQQDAMRSAAQERANIKYDTRLDFLKRQEERDSLIGQLKANLESARMGAQSGYDSSLESARGSVAAAQAHAAAQVAAARIGAAVGHESNALQRQMMPFQMASTLYNPYAVNFGQLTPTTTTEKVKENRGFWGTLGGILGGAASVFTGGLSGVVGNLFNRGGSSAAGSAATGYTPSSTNLFTTGSTSGYGGYAGSYGGGNRLSLGNNWSWNR